MPIIGDMIQMRDIQAFALDDDRPPVGCALERTHTMPKMGVRSAYVFGWVCGQVAGVLTAWNWRWDTVSAQVWRRQVCNLAKKDIIREANHVGRVYPMLDIQPGRRTKPHEGIVEAACIAEWCRLYSPFKETT